MQTSKLSVARAYAVGMHGAQRYGALPYSHHLDAVAAVLAPYGEDAQVIGYLHDVVEDTGATVDDVRARFGDLVAECVALLTDEPGETRKERKTKTYAKLARVTGPQTLALVVKVADRLSNVRACVADANRPMWAVYQGEHPVFKASAFRPGLCDALWTELDTLLSEEALPQSA
ncbi:HD domain-containing protein [Paracidovorax valerianellae]|uniref:HD domain-containing protein n=1 Tax=Paracidovorax valerianellae TaxID=187868 RepID=A0A1G7CWY7_9BURK|nr:HD domain-containing protein [Paracidovorax valerianellae]MDA8446316.1 HD domain-containing protein [Paracidovorax valerianellae]SDE43807.1 HD domain-containing protein [Paracidovorax valerianellae]